MIRSDFPRLALTLWLGFLSVILPVSGPAHARQDDPGKTLAEVLTVGALTREMTIYVPASITGDNRTGERYPLVLAFHGFGSTPKALAGMSGLNRLAEKERFIVVYPVGIQKGWNGKAAVKNPGDRDTDFVRAVLRHVRGAQPVDPARVYAVGVSNGGFLVHDLAIELPDEIAAFAAVASTIGEPLSQRFEPRRPVNLLMMNSRQDPVITWDGHIRRIGFLFRDSIIKSVEDTDRYWQQKNGCAVAPEVSTIQNGLARKRYLDCRNGVALEQWVIDGGGHNWPGQDANAFNELLFGKATPEIDATRIIWNFFKNISLQKPVKTDRD